MQLLSSLSSSITSSSFLIGLGIGVASTTIASKYLYRQVRDSAHVDQEDNESGGIWFFTGLDVGAFILQFCFVTQNKEWIIWFINDAQTYQKVKN